MCELKSEMCELQSEMCELESEICELCTQGGAGTKSHGTYKVTSCNAIIRNSHFFHNCCKFFIKPARSAGFSRIKKIPYQAPQKMYILEKHIFGTKISMLRFLFFFEKFKELPGATLLCF